MTSAPGLRGLRIRRYQPADRDAVRRLHEVALRAASAHAGRGPWDDDLDDVEGAYLRDGGEFLVGLHAGHLAAMGALRRNSAERAELKRMRVLPELQGRGFGQAMLEALERRARELGFSVLHLDTSTRQGAARGLYAKNGYREVRRAEWRGLELIFMEKRLDGEAGRDPSERPIPLR